ncbi:MAG: MarR family transcriptional regulator [Armatimonadota bacterium]|nr:MarR family transcriptional regulator [bacterium]
MSDVLYDQAQAITDIMPRLTRRLFTIGADDPGLEFPVAQIRVCSILLDGPRTMSALSKELGISLSAITQIADRLEKSGMVERVTETCDRRVKCLQLADRGKEVMRIRVAKRVERVCKVLNQLAPEDRDRALTGLKTLFDAAAAIDPEI